MAKLTKKQKEAYAKLEALGLMIYQQLQR